jgi:hypothetical protein
MGQGCSSPAPTSNASNFHDLKALDIDKNDLDFKRFDGQVLRNLGGHWRRYWWGGCSRLAAALSPPAGGLGLHHLLQMRLLPRWASQGALAPLPPVQSANCGSRSQRRSHDASGACLTALSAAFARLYLAPCPGLQPPYARVLIAGPHCAGHPHQPNPQPGAGPKRGGQGVPTLEELPVRCRPLADFDPFSMCPLVFQACAPLLRSTQKPSLTAAKGAPDCLGASPRWPSKAKIKRFQLSPAALRLQRPRHSS